MYSEEEYKRPDSSESYLLDQWVRMVHAGGGGVFSCILSRLFLMEPHPLEERYFMR